MYKLLLSYVHQQQQRKHPDRPPKQAIHIVVLNGNIFETKSEDQYPHCDLAFMVPREFRVTVLKAIVKILLEYKYYYFYQSKEYPPNPVDYFTAIPEGIYLSKYNLIPEGDMWPSQSKQGSEYPNVERIDVCDKSMPASQGPLPKLSW